MIETRKDGRLAQKLVAGFFSDFFREGAVVFDFLERALAAFETGIFGKVNGSHSTLSDPFLDPVTAAQHLPVFEGWEHSSPFADHLRFWQTNPEILLPGLYL
jgi:hypothetical protein